MQDLLSYQREAWNRQSKTGSPWCQPVSSEQIAAAQVGDWSVILTPNKKVPAKWFGELADKDVLCLASGGGQQAPILAAAGARVTSFDNSDEQLAKDAFVAERDGIAIRTLQGDMADLSAFADNSFDLIFHPVSNVFVSEIRPVWNECYRVLRHGGRLLAGFMNPVFFLFDHEDAARDGKLEVKYKLPFADLHSLPPAKLADIQAKGYAYEFSHSLEEQIGGQTNAGFLIADLYEDNWNDQASPLNKYSPMYIATLARKLETSSS
ncbi:class I SAM-dependent methyltransferase [Pelagicoccus sp. SDUM812005]|uniref:class I SAM-dependent methyltransferase n=1 Tax=Pelagicoccus sp. SDUM812005 TaxID=3041257 RepID=UPI00280C5574|nr:class I SAM-dependent methyltransferase [Pelagicoccus sp. SDUM812005]MDQ8182066.1 class I SAM-dependent methyltransferase [Pelagicoccus sp. SDUM812005]